jgi:hypothetical protein
VSKRLDATIEELEASLDNLDVIVDGRAEHAPLTSERVAVSLLMIFPEAEDQQKIDREVVDQARAAVKTLRAALEEWSTQVRGTLRT